MLQEIISLYEQHEKLETSKVKPAMLIWEDFNKCFTRIQWKSVCLLPGGEKNFSVWLWKKGFQTDMGMRRYAIRIGTFPRLFNVLERLKNLDIDSIKGLSRESRRRMHDIFPNIPEVTKPLKTRTLTQTMELPGFLAGNHNTSIAVNVYCHVSEDSCLIHLGDPLHEDLNSRLKLISFTCLAEKYHCADRLKILLKVALELRKQKIKDLIDFQEKLENCLRRYLVFQQV